MFEFLRKYQRILFMVVAGFVFSSFIFFGTFSSYVANDSREDRVVGTLVDGSPLKSLELEGLTRFLSGDWQEEHPQVRNLLNDGVVRRDLLLSGIGQKIVEVRFDHMQEELNERVERARRYKGYHHPHAPFLSAKAIWERISPDLNRDWASLIAEEKQTPKTFELLAHLYEQQRSVPSAWLRNFLMSQEKQYSWIQPDPSLPGLDLSLFGFKSLTDWFGPQFLSDSAKFILNAAILAEGHGVKVSFKEAKKDLRRLFAEAAGAYQKAKIPVGLSYQDQLKMLGLEEYEAVNLWRKVLLFRRWMERVGSSVLVDRLGAKEFSVLAGQEAVVETFRMDPNLKCKTATEALGLYLYWKAVFPQTVSQLDVLPTEIPTPAEVLKRAPELVGVQYRAKVSAVDKREAALYAPLKEVLDYELGEEGWKILKKKFSFLKNASGKDREERLTSLEKLDATQRAKIDLFSRRQLVDLHPEWVEQAFAKASSKMEELCLSAGEIRLPHLENPKELGTLFQTILTSPEDALAKLQKFESGEGVFRFEEIEKCSDEFVKTFSLAKQDGTIDRLVAKVLGKEGEEKARQLLHDWEKSSYRENSWGAKRFYGVAIAAKNDLKKNREDSRWIAQPADSPLVAQFKLQRSEERIKRSGKEDWLAQEPFSMQPQNWSSIHISPDGELVFFYLSDRIFQEPPLQNQILGAQEILSLDAKQTLAEWILAKTIERE